MSLIGKRSISRKELFSESNSQVAEKLKSFEISKLVQLLYCKVSVFVFLSGVFCRLIVCFIFYIMSIDDFNFFERWFLYDEDFFLIILQILFFLENNWNEWNWNNFDILINIEIGYVFDFFNFVIFFYFYFYFYFYFFSMFVYVFSFSFCYCWFEWQN